MKYIWFRNPVGLWALLGALGLFGASPLLAAEPLEQQLNIRNQRILRTRSQQTAEELVTLGNQSLANGDYDTGIAALETAIARYSALGNAQAVREISETLAKTLVQLERYDEAENVIQQGLSIAIANDDVPGQIYGLNNLGTAYIQQGQTVRAQEAFGEALQLAKAAGDFSGMGLSLSNLGLAAWQLRDLDSARTYYEAATNYRLQAGDDLGLAHSSNSLGMIYQLLGEDGKALGAYLVARRAALEISHVPTLLTALDGLIKIYSDRGNTEQLRTYIGERVVMTPEDASPEQQLGLFVGLGRYYEQIEDAPRAQAAYRRALEIAEDVGAAEQETYILNRLQALATS